jgi:hypothetical protein
MDTLRNPYAPGAGSPPPAFAGRGALLTQARLTLDRVRLGRAAKSFIAVGLRGVGKTVLLVRVSDLCEERGWRVCMIEARDPADLTRLLLPQLRRVLLDLDRIGALSEKVKRGLRIFRSFLAALKVKHGDLELVLDVEPEVGTADSGDLEADLPDLFVAIGEAAAARETAVALLIDEVQYLSEREMSALIMGLHRVAQRNLPIVLIAAGLPQVVGLTGRSKSYAERLFDFPELGALEPADARRALVEPAGREGVAFEPAALEAILDVTQGYPFFLQEWGYAAWNIAARSPITAADVEAASREAIAKLDKSFFRVRFDRLTPREKDYLRAMAELGPGAHRSGDIAELLGVRVQAAGPLRGGLIRKGMIYSPAHGDTAFTVPLFDAFLKRIMPVWHPPPRPA